MSLFRMLQSIPARLGGAVAGLSIAAAASVALCAGGAQAEPAIWVVKSGHATVYLFGTVHLLKPDAKWMTPKIQKAFDESQTLTEEIDNVDNPAAMQPLVMQLGFDTVHPLSSLLTLDENAKLEAAEKDLGLPHKALDTMRPWMAALTLTVLPMTKKGYDPAAGVDRELKAAADARKEPVDGFETAEQQLRFFADMSDAQQIEFLHQSLTEYNDALARIDQLEKAWEDGDVNQISTIVNEDLRKESPELYAKLLVHRNEAFAAKIAERLKGTGVSFVAVGAGHLAGPDSVQAQLAKLGFKARRL
jgi:uncharacterized protein YbaP (TraB family)